MQVHLLQTIIVHIGAWYTKGDKTAGFFQFLLYRLFEYLVGEAYMRVLKSTNI